MRVRSVVIGIVVVIVLVLLGAYIWSWRSAIAPVSANEASAGDFRIISRGAELAAIGDCATCHTTSSGKSYAGGLPIATPFGTIYSTNITPDAETGIGKWSEAAFHRSMREGVDREGQHLYPAFPYDHFTHTTDDDIHAIYAFLMSQPAVHNVPPDNQLTFPLGFRPLLAGWKLLFLDQGLLKPVSGKDAEWNRGRYLAEGLGHCGACHTPRNFLGAENKGKAFTGATAEGWFAPSLKARKWTADELTEYLSTGWQASHGVAAGPMAGVVNDLRQAPASDVHAIAVYIASLSTQGESAPPAAPGNPPAQAPAEVVALYDGTCAKCHRDQGVGPSKALPLSTSTALHLSGSGNAVRVVLNGINAYRETGGPYMPGFSGMLSDQQIAAVLNYARERFTDKPQWGDVQDEIKKARQGAEQ